MPKVTTVSKRKRSRRPRPAEAPTVETAVGRRSALLLVGIAVALAFYLASFVNNRLGFFQDESSIAYNAYMIAQSGTDEHGVRWPLYFRAFGEYKNPPYIYLLAAFFKILGPSVGLARLLSALLGFGAAFCLGALATRLSAQRRVGVIVAVSALVTPWLFEVSRLVLEAAIYPLALALFLLALQRACGGERWRLADSAWVGMTLALLTYGYSSGRLLGFFLAGGLILFARRVGWGPILETWLVYGLLLVPFLVFGLRQPGALMARFHEVSYVTPDMSAVEVARIFVLHYLAAFDPVDLLFRGDPQIRHHVPGMGGMLVATVGLSVAGAIRVLRHHRGDSWWRFVFYGLVVSALPAALAGGEYHFLRLVPVPIFLLVLTVPTLQSLCASGSAQSARRAKLWIVLLLTAGQAVLFQWQFYRIGPTRQVAFDNGYVQALDTALAFTDRPIYLDGGTRRDVGIPHIHAYWYGALRGVDRSAFVQLNPGERPPSGALVISSGILILRDGRTVQGTRVWRAGPR